MGGSCDEPGMYGGMRSNWKTNQAADHARMKLASTVYVSAALPQNTAGMSELRRGPAHHGGGNPEADEQNRGSGGDRA